MKRFSDWLGQRTYLQSAALYAVLWGLGTWVVHALVDEPELEPALIVIRMVGSIVFGLTFAAIIRWQIRRAGGRSVTSALRDAVKAQSLPPDVDPDTWLPSLRRSEAQTARSLWLAPIIFGLFVLLGVFLSATAGGDIRSAVLGAVCVVLFVAVAIYTIIDSRRRLPVLRSFISEIRGRQSAPTAER